MSSQVTFNKTSDNHITFSDTIDIRWNENKKHRKTSQTYLQ